MILLVKNCILEKVKNVISYLDKCVNENILPDSVVTKTQQCSWTSTRKVSIVLKTLAFQTLQTKLVITADVTMLAHTKKDCNDMKKFFKLFKIKHDDMRLVSLIAITAVYSFTNCSHCRLTWPSLAWLHLRSSQHIASVASVLGFYTPDMSCQSGFFLALVASVSVLLVNWLCVWTWLFSFDPPCSLMAPRLLMLLAMANLFKSNERTQLYIPPDFSSLLIFLVLFLVPDLISFFLISEL